VASDLNLHVDREHHQRHDCRHGLSYDMWMAARKRAGEAERCDQLRMIEEQAWEVTERGLQ
jgi:hypothetical protein